MSEKETVAQMLRRLEEKNRKSLCYLCEEVLGEEYCKESNHECETAWLVLADRIEAEQRAIIDAQDGSAHKIMRAWAEQRGYKWNDGESITQWLDRCFLRLPLVDGKPLAKGMVLEGQDWPVIAFCVFDDGSGEVFPCEESGENVLFPEYDEPDRDSTLHLAKPKTLDADGVPIEVGDTVYLNNHRNKYEVTKIEPSRAVHLRRIEDGYPTFAAGTNLSHREPDSLEKLRDDVSSTLDRSSAAFPCGREGLEEIRDRLTALIEKGGE